MPRSSNNVKQRLCALEINTQKEIQVLKHGFAPDSIANNAQTDPHLVQPLFGINGLCFTRPTVPEFKLVAVRLRGERVKGTLLFSFSGRLLRAFSSGNAAGVLKCSQ